MAIWNYTPKLDLWSGLVIGGGLLLAPFVIPVVAGAVRPVLKTVIKGAYTVYDTSRDFVATAVDETGALLEEVRSEVRTELTGE